MNKYQIYVEHLYKERAYTTDLKTLALGLCEEAGELAKAVNWYHNPEYKHAPNRDSDSVEHELHDLLVYAYAIANVLGIDLEFPKK